MPNIPDEPDVYFRLVNPLLTCFGAVFGEAHNIFTHGLDGIDIAFAPGHVFPDPVLPCTVDDQNFDAWFQQAGDARDFLRVARPDQNGQGPQVQGLHLGMRNAAAQGLNKIGHHGF